MASCKDCLCGDLCIDRYVCGDRPACEHFKDRTQFVELPCKVGTKVFVSPDRGKHFHKATLYGCDEKGTFLVFVNDNELSKDEKHIVENPNTHCFYDWFLKVYTREAAEKALKEREKE